MRRRIDASKLSINRIYKYFYFPGFPEALSFIQQNKQRVISVTADPSPSTCNSFAHGDRKKISKALETTVDGNCCISWVAAPDLLATEGKNLNGAFTRDTDYIFNKSQIAQNGQHAAQLANLVKEVITKRDSLVRIELEGIHRDKMMSRDITDLQSNFDGLSEKITQIEATLLGMSSQMADLTRSVKSSIQRRADIRKFRLDQASLLVKVLIGFGVFIALAVLFGGIHEAVEVFKDFIGIMS